VTSVAGGTIESDTIQCNITDSAGKLIVSFLCFGLLVRHITGLTYICPSECL